MTVMSNLCTQGMLPPTSIGENGPGLGRSHDTLDFGVFSMIINIGEFIYINSYAVSRFVDHVIDILKIYSLTKEHQKYSTCSDFDWFV